MKERIIKIQSTLRFRRWTRKGYGIFRSLRQCVTIGCLNKVETDSSLNKQNPAALFVSEIKIRKTNDADSDEEDTILYSLLQKFLYQIEQQAISIVCFQTAIVSKIKNQQINLNRRMLHIVFIRFFYVSI